VTLPDSLAQSKDRAVEIGRQIGLDVSASPDPRLNPGRGNSSLKGHAMQGVTASIAWPGPHGLAACSL